MHLIKISKEISSKILTIGPDFHPPQGGVSAVIEIYSKNFEVFNFISSYRNKLKFFVFIKCLFKLFIILTFNHKIEVIHIHAASYGSFYRKFIISIIGKFIFKKKIIYHIHGGGFKDFYEKGKIIKWLIKKLFSIVDVAVCLSQSWYEFYYSNFKIKKIIILPNIIDFPEPRSNNEKRGLINLLFLGLIRKEKGIYDLLNVISRRKDKYVGKIKLLIGGNGETKSLNEFVKKNQLDGLVEFLGWVEKRKKIDVFNNSDIFILPSYKEGLPLSILEAMSYGLAIISSKVGGIPEIVINNKNGILIEPGNLEHIENSIDFFLVNKEKINDFGMASKSMVKKYLPDSVLKEITSLYKSILINE